MTNPNGAPGLYGNAIINGINVTGEIQTESYDYAFSTHDPIVQNTGLHTTITGAHVPMLSLDGFRKSLSSGATTAFDLTRGQGATRATDSEWIIAFEKGYGASPVDGDKATLFDGTLTSGPGADYKPDDLIKLPLKFSGRGNFTAPGYRLYKYTGTATTTSAAIDTNPNAYTLPTLGGIIMTQVITAFSTDTMVATFTSSTSSGGSYTTFGTCTLTGGAVGAEWLEIASGTTINRYIKITVTKTGTSDTPEIRFYFARKWR